MFFLVRAGGLQNARQGWHETNDGESNAKDFQRRKVAFELYVHCYYLCLSGRIEMTLLVAEAS